MRTPGRCTNVEGCWISASDRDVWLPVGDDFVCPNCGERLTAPPRQAISFRGLRQATARAAVVTAGVAALAVLAIKLTPPESIVQSRVVALLRAPALLLSSDFLGLRTHPASGQMPQPLVAGSPAAQKAAGLASAAPVAPTQVQAHTGAREPVPPGALANWAAPSRPQGVLLYAASNDRPALPAPAANPARTAPPVRTPEDEFAAATFVTLFSESTVTPPKSLQRPVVLPISFGKPPAPEGDLPPADRVWHRHGMVNRHRNIILPGPGPDPLADLYDTPSLLR